MSRDTAHETACATSLDAIEAYICGCFQGAVRQESCNKLLGSLLRNKNRTTASCRFRIPYRRYGNQEPLSSRLKSPQNPRYDRRAIFSTHQIARRFLCARLFYRLKRYANTTA